MEHHTSLLLLLLLTTVRPSWCRCCSNCCCLLCCSEHSDLLVCLLQLVHECLLVLLQVCNQPLLSSIELVPLITTLKHKTATPPQLAPQYATAQLEHHMLLAKLRAQCHPTLLSQNSGPTASP
jgi:hypothetical protein